MKKMYTLLTAVGITFLTTAAASAQRVIAVGARLNPDGAGLTGKFYMNRHFNIEGQINGASGLSYRYGKSKPYGPSITGICLLEYNLIFPDPSWRIFVGPGLHAGAWDRYRINADGNTRGPQAIFGIDGILGAEYIFKKIPLGISADVKPALNIVTEAAFFPNNMVGLSARLYFGHTMKRKPHIPRTVPPVIAK